MLEKFKSSVDSILKELKFSSGESHGKILIAVSGGVDSVVMLSLFKKAGYNCGVAHCNFGLRDKESDADENFVEQLATHFEFQFHSGKFHTKAFATDNQLSTQMAARQLRYSWFDELTKVYEYDAVAVAHHADDVAETMLLNLVRGTGIAGVHGIKAINGSIIRPLLFANRIEIEEYAKEQKLFWREDASNQEDYYLRNKIRNQVFPILKEMNPLVVDAFAKHANIMSGYESLLNNFIQTVELQLVKYTHKNSVMSVDIPQLMNFPAPEILLYHLVAKLGFNAVTCSEIIQSNRTGAKFLVPGFKLVKGRDALVIFNLDAFDSNAEFLIHENENETEINFGNILMEHLVGHAWKNASVPDDIHQKNVAYLDGDKLTFPLTVRKWQKGDSFHPLGMKGKKLLSDFMIDEKFSPDEKELVYLLTSENEIVWVIGHRIDDRFKLNDNSNSTRKFIWKPVG